MTYAGPSSRLLPDAGLSLDADRWGWQPKIDGCYAALSTDAAGRVVSVLSRAGQPLREGADLLGLHVGPPLSVLVGELEAHTEAGIAAANRRGWSAVHLFDALALDGRPLAAAPYLARHVALSASLDALAQLAAAELPDTAPARLRVRRATGAMGRPRLTTRARDLATGAFVSPVPHDHRRLLIVPLHRGASAGRDLWARHVERDGGEGLVAVRLDAPLGRRDAKRKIKLTDTADCTVLDVSPAVVRLSCPRTSPAGWRGESFVVACSRPVAVGDVLEVAHDGWYASGAPRFARVVRARPDIASRGRVAA